MSGSDSIGAADAQDPSAPLRALRLLQVQRRLLEAPPGPGRFRAYLDAMLADAPSPQADAFARGGRPDRAERSDAASSQDPAAAAAPAERPDDLALPLSAFNPMAKEHVTRRLDDLLAADVEATLAATLAELAPSIRNRLAAVLPLRVGLVVADDAAGGWTDRVLTDVQHRFESAPMLRRGFLVVLLWSGDPDVPGPALRRRVEVEVRAAVERAAFELEHGPAATLAERMAQEGAAARAAGAVPGFGDLPAPDSLSPSQRREIAATLAPYRESTGTPIVVAALYGDDAAASVGYPPLGVPAAGGLLLAAAEALDGRDAV